MTWEPPPGWTRCGANFSTGRLAAAHMICVHHRGAKLALFSCYDDNSPTYESWWYELSLPNGTRRSTPTTPNAEAVPFSWADSALSRVS